MGGSTMQNVAFLIERFGLLAIFLNVLLSAGGLPLPCYPALMLAAALAALGRRVLLVDLDPQANATTGVGIDHRVAFHRY